MIILGIETSCDETAAAVYDTHRGLLASHLFSQVDLHQRYGGVVPEIASRSHLEKIAPIITHTLHQAGVPVSKIDAVAVTHKPGLPGSLLVGLCFAKAIAYTQKKHLIGINHLEGHVFSSFLSHPHIPFPHLCLTASGGHTSIYLVEDFGVYTEIGTTKDDASGEAFDKVAKLLNLPYPGGPSIERLAQEVHYVDFFAYPRGTNTDLNFSFSGIKTAVLYHLVKAGYTTLESKKGDDSLVGAQQLKRKVASSLLVCVKDIFLQKITRALTQHPHIKAISFVGGVACNAYIKKELQAYAQTRGLAFYAPAPAYCTDNAAMIAFVGAYKAQKGQYDLLSLDIF